MKWPERGWDEIYIKKILVDTDLIHGRDDRSDNITRILVAEHEEVDWIEVAQDWV